MADPLSITLGILTVLGACSAGAKSLRSAYQLPQEYARLELELDHLHDVVKFVDGLVVEHQLNDTALIKGLTLARSKLQEVHNFIRDSLRHSGQSPIKRRTLVRHKTRLAFFAKDIETAKTHIVDSILLSNFYRSCALRLSAQSTGIDCPSQQCTNWTFLSRKQSKEDRSQNLLHSHPAQLHCELGGNPAQKKQLIQKSTVGEANDRRLMSVGWRDEFEADKGYGGEGQCVADIPEDTASDATDVFDDCVSRFSEDHPHTLIDRLRAHFTHRMSPDDFYETPLTFVGEQYTVESRLGEPAAVVAMTEMHCSSIRRLHKYFLIYAEAPRLWRRVTVSATILRSSQFSSDLRVAAPDLIFAEYKTLPGKLQCQLQGLLKNLTLLETVTKISLTITEHSTGIYTIDTPNAVVSEDFDESSLNNEEQMLQDVEHMDFPQYLQSEVIVQERIDAVTYIAQVESRLCMERKMPFSGAGLPGDDGLKRFWQDLTLAKSLYDCNGVVQFMGVVLNDARTHMKSFLQELPALGTIRSILAHAELRKERVPWSIRANWASQIVTAVAEIHSKGFVVGMLHIDFTGVRSDGRAVLTLRKRGYRHSINRLGEIAPESRTVPMHSPQPREPDFPSDIFMLGMLLWHLAEHRHNIAGYICSRNACTSVPRHSCEHANPVDLPPCMDKEIPEAFNLVVSLCRQADPKKRPAARTLLQYLNAKSQPSEMADLQMRYANTHGTLPFCDECGNGVDLEASYHCNVCCLANFDLCRHCASQGIHCFNKEHRLVKRVFRNGKLQYALSCNMKVP